MHSMHCTQEVHTRAKSLLVLVQHIIISLLTILTAKLSKLPNSCQGSPGRYSKMTPGVTGQYMILPSSFFRL